VAVFREVAEALVYLHGKAILHCDLKPANVLLDDRGQIRLADFGQARMSDEAGPAMGTLFYMAPEQTESRGRPDVRSDVYSLGALAYTMLVGHAPFATETASEEIKTSRSTRERVERYRALIDSSPAPTEHHRVDGIDKTLVEIIDRCLKKEPAERFENAQQVLEALAVRERQRTRKPLVLLGLLGPLALLVAMAAVGVWAWYQAETGASRALTGQTLSNARGYAELITAVVDQNLSAVQRRVRREASRPEFLELVANVARSPSVASRARLQEHTESLHEAYRDRFFHSWVVADKNAVALARAPFDERVVGSRYAFREWFTGSPDIPPEDAPGDAVPRAGTGITLAFVSTATGNPTLVSVASPIRAEGDSEAMGVLAATLHLDTFNAWLSEAEGAPTSRGCPTRFGVLLNRGQLVRHPCPEGARFPPLAPEEFFELGAVQELVASSDGTAEGYRDPLRPGFTYLASHMGFSANPDWTTIVQHDSEEAMAPVTSLVERFQTLAWIAGGTAVLLVLTLWVLLFRLAKERSMVPSREKLIELSL
jgi:hypothetical protein